jgi:hypothetical protein
MSNNSFQETAGQVLQSPMIAFNAAPDENQGRGLQDGGTMDIDNIVEQLGEVRKSLQIFIDGVADEYRKVTSGVICSRQDVEKLASNHIAFLKWAEAAVELLGRCLGDSVVDLPQKEDAV